jgi:DNA repair protein RadC
MKKKFLLLVAILVIVITYRLVQRKKESQLGSIELSRPPKIRIVYSKKQKMKDRTQITSSAQSVEVLRSIWSSQMEVREEFAVLHLDRSNRVLGYQMLSKGGISGTVVDIRLIFSAALQSLASSIILAHNHPSGNLLPSTQDKAITRKIAEAGRIHEITVLDHIILTKEDYISFADEGYL